VEKIPNEGMPIPDNEDERGSLFIEYDVKFPSSLTEQQKQELQKIL
jgi:DnaJ family protein B protein 4